jgi:Protein of unknown function (DUF2752)
MDLLRGALALLFSALLASVRHRRLQGGRVEVSTVPHQTSLIELEREDPGRLESFVRPVALSMFVFYLFWNALWLVSGRIPDSILRAVTGLPCPTTGGTRSMIAMLHGQWIEAFLWNPFTPVYIALLVCSAAIIGRQVFRRERMVLNEWMVRAWIFSLAAGWIAKFALGPRYW